MRVRFHTTINKDLLYALKIDAIKENKKVNDVLEDLIYSYIKKKGIANMESLDYYIGETR